MLKAHFTYDINVLTSHEFSELADSVFGEDNIVRYDEVRDGHGYLKGFDLWIDVAGVARTVSARKQPTPSETNVNESATNGA